MRSDWVKEEDDDEDHCFVVDGDGLGDGYYGYARNNWEGTNRIIIELIIS